LATAGDSNTADSGRPSNRRAVFVIWLADGKFPTGRSLENPEAIEEERRYQRFGQGRVQGAVGREVGAQLPGPGPEAEPVRVEFDARGTDWGAVYLNDRLVYRPHNFDRQQTIYLPPGGYRLEITGVVRSDLWASGYLDLGRDSSRLVVIRFSKAEGVTVSGSPHLWIPD